MKKLVLATLLAVGMTGTAMAEVDKDAVIKYRQSAFTVAGWNMGVLGGMLKGDIEYNADEAKAAAVRINEMAKLVGDTFIDGTYEGSNAKAEIADEKEKFNGMLENFVKESEAMLTAASEKKTLAPQMGKLGGTCKTCHDDFKLD